MGGSRIFDWGGPRIDDARDAGKNVAIFALKSCPIGGGHGPVAPPPGTALGQFSLYNFSNMTTRCDPAQLQHAFVFFLKM